MYGKCLFHVLFECIACRYCEASVAAFALPCMFDYQTHRPVIANLNLCYTALVNGVPNDEGQG